MYYIGEKCYFIRRYYMNHDDLNKINKNMKSDKKLKFSLKDISKEKVI